jgi:hypothetical protein
VTVERVTEATPRHREAAHRMYRRLGFVGQPSEVFVWRPQ